MKCSKCGLDGLDVYVNYTRGRDQVERENAELRVEAKQLHKELHEVRKDRAVMAREVNSLRAALAAKESG